MVLYATETYALPFDSPFMLDTLPADVDAEGVRRRWLLYIVGGAWPALVDEHGQGEHAGCSLVVCVWSTCGT